MKKKVLVILKYFSFFNYPPTAEEIYAFLKIKINFDRFTVILEKMVKEGVIVLCKQNEKSQITNNKSISNLKFKISKQARYTIGEYSNKRSKIKYQRSKTKNNNVTMEQCNNYLKRYQTSKNKLTSWKFKLYIKLLALFSQIKLVGLSGSISMMNADEDDDVDLFIITSKNRLFTGRFITLILAQLLNLRRRRKGSATQFFHKLRKLDTVFFRPPHPVDRGPRRLSQKQVSSLFQDKVCLNLFFDESNLAVPKFKQTEYVAHEVLQMRPIVNKSQTYEKFLQANLWVQKIFPNTRQIFNFQFSIFNQFQISNFKNLDLNKNLKLKINNLGCWIEEMLKRLQLSLINRHRTTEIITDSQLWFHPEDFGKKLPFNLGRQEGKDGSGDKN